MSNQSPSRTSLLPKDERLFLKWYLLPVKGASQWAAPLLICPFDAKKSGLIPGALAQQQYYRDAFGRVASVEASYFKAHAKSVDKDQLPKMLPAIPLDSVSIRFPETAVIRNRLRQQIKADSIKKSKPGPMNGGRPKSNHRPGGSSSEKP